MTNVLIPALSVQSELLHNDQSGCVMLTNKVCTIQINLKCTNLDTSFTHTHTHTHKDIIGNRQ